MREPRSATERRRLHVGRHDVAVGRANRRIEPRAACGEPSGELRPLVADRAVRLDEDQKDVRAFHACEVGVHRRTFREGRRARKRRGDELRLSRVGVRHRRGRHALDGPARARSLADEERHRQRGDARERTSLGGVRHRIGDEMERPSQAAIQQPEERDDGCDDEENQPPRRDARHHGDHVGHQTKIPVQVDVAAIERGRGDFRVASDDEHDPHSAQPAKHRARRWAEPARGAGEREETDRELDRQLATPMNGRCRPDVGERQRHVEKEQRCTERSPAPRPVDDRQGC